MGFVVIKSHLSTLEKAFQKTLGHPGLFRQTGTLRMHKGMKWSLGPIFFKNSCNIMEAYLRYTIKHTSKTSQHDSGNYLGLSILASLRGTSNLIGSHIMIELLSFSLSIYIHRAI